MAKNNFEIFELEEGLHEFGSTLRDFDIERVEEQTLKEAAGALAEMVRQAVVAEDKIQSPANFLSEYDGGPGPSMSHRTAWTVEKSGDGYTVRPHPKVEQRAVVLNYGYPGRITPNSEEALKFNINGVPVFAKSVDGPDRTRYWQAALERFEKSDELERIAQQELRKEALE